jgi:prepilin peptidase CpaA
MTATEIAGVALGTAAVATDLSRRRIPNWLTASGICAGMVCGAFSAGWSGAANAAAGAAAGFAIFVILHWLGGMGGGDVKLMAAFGSLLGPGSALVAAVFAAIAGAVLAAGALAWKPRTHAIPYAPAIVAGAWLVFLGRR